MSLRNGLILNEATVKRFCFPSEKGATLKEFAPLRVELFFIREATTIWTELPPLKLYQFPLKLLMRQSMGNNKPYLQKKM